MSNEKGGPFLHLVLTAVDCDDHERELHIACAAGSWEVLSRNADPEAMLRALNGINFVDDADLLDEFMSSLDIQCELVSEITTFFVSSSASVVRISMAERGVTERKTVRYEVRRSDGGLLEATSVPQVAHDVAKKMEDEFFDALKLRRENQITPDNPDVQITSTQPKPGQ